MPEVKLISYTGHGNPDPFYAAKLLAFTKNTRLQMTPDGMDSFMDRMGDQKVLEDELEYMSSSIPSSWEFVDVIFLVTKVSRATAQQITRTRTASFAMQSQRVTDMRDVSWDKIIGPDYTVDDWFDEQMKAAIASYEQAIARGMSLEDARDLLPIGVHCNLVAKYNFRNFVELVRARESLRVQAPYRETVRQMKAEIFALWPWSEPFFEHPHAKAIRMIEQVAEALKEEQGAMYRGASGTLAKAADLLKK